MKSSGSSRTLVLSIDAGFRPKTRDAPIEQGCDNIVGIVGCKSLAGQQSLIVCEIPSIQERHP